MAKNELVIKKEDFEIILDMKANLENQLKPYRDIVVSDVEVVDSLGAVIPSITVAEARKKRAEVNKFLTNVETERKRIQKLVGEYTLQFTPVINSVINEIDSKIEAIEKVARDEKLAAIRKRTNELFKELGLTEHYNWKKIKFDLWWSKIFDERWLNKTHTTWEDELVKKLTKVKADIELLTLSLGYNEIDDFLQNLDMDAAIRSRKPIAAEAINDDIVVSPKETTATTEPAGTWVPGGGEFEVEFESRVFTFRTVIDSDKYKLLTEFMKQNNIPWKEM